MADENKKPETMLEALEDASEDTDLSITQAFRDVQKKHPELDIASLVRRFHFATIKTFTDGTLPILFHHTLGIIGKFLLPHLTEEEKEALRNDKLSNLL